MTWKSEIGSNFTKQHFGSDNILITLLGKLKFEIKIKRLKYKLEKINFFHRNCLTCHVNGKKNYFSLNEWI
ncbi:hypothetical protein BpHYR1_014547 [Brachionus plicatilis]|uniref:Uncharacterized protein n=1 Tax=Brachionus plicatilis TaxID=10195 RepID=A0A3M7PTQ3_BRAPC|nr:hypothetical protein BpHYR1_014547 [Brachionus plicatilis]